MPRPKNYFSPGDIDNLRRGFYTQAPTVAALVLAELADDGQLDRDDVDQAAAITIDLIEALVDAIQGVPT
jgi:pyruvate dehydrogenase complex dehydrogenase (E1) component